MITLKEALKLGAEELKSLKEELTEKIKQNNDGAYVEQLINSDISTSGEGVPIAIKDIINVKDWEVTCCSTY